MYLLSRQPETAKGQMETVFHLSEVVCATLKNQDFLESIIPMISEKVIESITPRILKLVDDSIKPHLEKVKQCQEAITHKEIEINKQNKVIKSLQEKLNNVETRIEEQEQYSRRTSLRFNRITFQFFLVPEDELLLSVC
jgi:septal ring factor EnvC (AmiA/AmiB activator)